MTRIPRISTRGYYDLTTGATLKKNKYFLYPKKSFEKIIGVKELTIMIHGLRNNNAGAINKIKIAQRRLRQLGYSYPVVGYSYDSNTTGAHIAKHAKKALCIGQLIAKKNGRHLASFLMDFKKWSPNTKFRLIGHSLGSQVILSTIENLAKQKKFDILESIHFFGASITEDVPSSKKYKKQFKTVISEKIVNFYSPSDEILGWADTHNLVKNPLGLRGCKGKSMSCYYDKKVQPKNHRFASYVETLLSFP